MKITKRVARITAGALAGVMTLAVGGALAFAATAVAAPFDPTQDTSWIGTVTIYNAAGQVVTSGDATDPLSAQYMVGSATPPETLRTTRTTIGLVGPQPSVNPGLWSGANMNGSTLYPLPAPAPAVVSSATTPQGAMLATSQSFAVSATAFTPNTGDLANVYQIRLRSVGTTAGYYNATTITIDPVTKIWTQIDPPPAPPVTTTTPPTTTPPVTTTTPPVTTTTPPVTTTTPPVTTPPVTTTTPPVTTPPVTTTTPPVTTTTPPVTTTTSPVTTTTSPVTTTTSPVTTTTAPAATMPGAPTGVSAIAGNTEATVSWTAGSNGGSAITSYEVTATPGGQTAITTGATHATVTGLTNGTEYTFTVTATNTVGASAASEASTAVTPSAASSTTTTSAPAATTPAPTSTTPGTGVIPVGAPNTGAGGTAGSNNGLMDLGSLALLLAGAGATLVVRRRQQV